MKGEVATPTLSKSVSRAKASEPGLACRMNIHLIVSSSLLASCGHASWPFFLFETHQSCVRRRT
eukprot:3974584-Pleurochrysis_carterae.AAC.1